MVEVGLILSMELSEELNLLFGRCDSASSMGPFIEKLISPSTLGLVLCCACKDDLSVLAQGLVIFFGYFVSFVTYCLHSKLVWTMT